MLQAASKSLRDSSQQSCLPACLPACLRFIVPDLSPIYTHLIYSQGLRLLDDLRNYRTHLHAEWAGHCPNLKLDFYES
jgi:hypothetical protein